ncbi:hypothetical protein ALI144C_42100 [Actinosynnema sp. ALI-1.44]|uniref:toll/interleukin-1 receptor domain-containing protein n=1 Tax=Actinosynnema sp. ALI-1.44 TaxID=1933779 RepID=UPI00097C7335|nr:TIR domain-containing protein [Actinosynnema sp. ALI-1.44]ONI72620.1 hypothetical protein ALI144C_42100 [Actinosynnema sp. ALI-1.44]
MAKAGEAPSSRYDVCLSFAGEQRQYVEEVAELLKVNAVKVFYDSDETGTMWGTDLYEFFDDIYYRRSKLCVLFVSADYARKTWTRLEWRSVQDRVMKDRRLYLLPVRFDDTRIPGIGDSIGYIDARVTTPRELVDILVGKLELAAGKSTVATYIAVATEGAGRSEAVMTAALKNSRIDLPSDLLHHSDHQSVAVVPMEKAGPLDLLTTFLPHVEDEASARGCKVSVGVHMGEIAGVFPEWDGADVRAAIAMIDDAVVLRTFAAATRADLIVAVSSEWYKNAVRSGRSADILSTYSQARLSDGQSIWLRVPGYPKPKPVTEEKASRKANVPAKVTNFYDKVRAKHIGDIYYPSGDGDD